MQRQPVFGKKPVPTGRKSLLRSAWEFSNMRRLALPFLLFFFPFFLVHSQAAELTPKPEPVEMLDATGVDASLRVYLIQGKPWDVLENETLVKILHRLPDFPRRLTERWAFVWNAEAREATGADPDAWLGQFFSLRFTVLTVQKYSLPNEAAERFGFGDYYEVHVELDGTRAVLFTREIPKAWKDRLTRTEETVQIDQPGSAVAMFLKAGAAKSGENQKDPQAVSFYFATDRVAWYPKDRLVGRLGMDLGLFDLIQDRQKIDAKERETFYQLLAAISRAKPGTLFAAAEAKLGKKEDGRQRWTSAASLFNQPEQARAELALLTGDVRRAIRVEVRDPDIVERFGIRHYYELYLFTPDSQNNPVVVCVPELPAEMPIGSGPNYCQRIEVAGIMLKSWAFTSDENAQAEGERQLAPLLIGSKPVWVRMPESAESPWPGTIAVAGMVVGLFVIWYFLRRGGRSSRRTTKPKESL